MATVTINTTISSTGTIAYPTYNSTPKEITQATEGMVGPGVVDVTTSEVTHDVVEGTVLLQNLDATNFVSWGTATGVYPFSLLASNEPTVIQIAADDTLYFAADTATCKVLILNWNA